MEVVTGEPDMIKPNSIENIKRLLQILRVRAGIAISGTSDEENKREWLFVENDGGIVNPILKLIFNTSEEVRQSFNWIVPQMGLLHLEINAAKSFMGLCWDVFMRSVCYELGFQSENALKYAKKGSDHHKLWEILEITYIAFVDELIYQFTVFCVSHGVPINIANYWMFATKVKNPNFLFVQQMVLTFLHGLMLLRKGGEVKQCRADLWCKE